MTKTNTELAVGASIFLALFVLIAGVMWLKEVNIAGRMVEYTIHFPNVGTLQLGDPVTVNGVKRGSVKRMYLRDARVVADVNLDKSVPLTDSSTITVQNVGLMGERMIGIQLSPKGTRIPPNTDERTTWIRGHFDSGIAEAMGMLGKVLGDVETLLANVETMLRQTVGDTHFVGTFQTVVGRLDTVSVLVEDLVAANKPGLDGTVANLHALTGDLKELFESNAGEIESIITNGADLTERALVIADEVDSIATAVQDIVAKVQQGEGTVGLLVENESFREDFEKSMASVDTLVKDINENGLKLRVKLGFGRDR
ncbi:MAG: MCE family protein, partial [Chitinivibrionales bacterium]|nr:MCE family protein [Chitinivibrionales bacterium]MBD3357502.1 MCE family protein [Chitinivibrionales bacterium]